MTFKNLKELNTTESRSCALVFNFNNIQYIVKKANYFRNFSKSFSKYSGKGAVNSIYSPVEGCTNPKIMA